MNKKYCLFLLLPAVLISSFCFKKPFETSYAEGTIVFDVDTIQALSHANGTVVNFVNPDIKEYWDNDSTDLGKLRTLYEYNSDISSFFDNSFDHDYVRQLYQKWDDFKPVNNTLTWKSNIKTNSYDIVVSLNDELTETLYEEKGLLEEEYTLINPFANQHYYWQVTAHTDRGDIKSSIFDFFSGDYKRTIDIPTVSNTRDVGGFSGRFGKMKEGLIYRSGRLDDADDSSRRALEQLDIQTDLDLRNLGEGKENPLGLNNYYLRTLLGYKNDFSIENRSKTIEAVRIFANPDNYPVIFHCAIGRDRTGTLSIILQALAGADRNYIIHDYYTSMFSVTGAFNKSMVDLNLGAVNDILNLLEENGTSLSDGAENFLKVQEDPRTHEMIGLTDEEIQNIRDIWSGKILTKRGMKTFKATDNYEGKAFVKIKSLGHKDVSMMVEKGSFIKAPYELDKSLNWFSEGSLFDFNKPIEKATFIYADYSNQYVVVIHFIGISRPDETLKINHNETITFEKYKIDGLKMKILTDEGKTVENIKINRDMHINIIYL